jgi:hypothetical protein
MASTMETTQDWYLHVLYLKKLDAKDKNNLLILGICLSKRETLWLLGNKKGRVAMPSLCG